MEDWEGCIGVDSESDGGGHLEQHTHRPTIAPKGESRAMTREVLTRRPLPPHDEHSHWAEIVAPSYTMSMQRVWKGPLGRYQSLVFPTGEPTPHRMVPDGMDEWWRGHIHMTDC